LQQELLWIGVPLLMLANLGMLLRLVAKGWPWQGMVAPRFGEGQNPKFHMEHVPQGGMGVI
jgi:hypothetical protein